MAEIAMRGRRARVEADGGSECRDRFSVRLSIIDQIAERHLPPRVAMVQRDRPDDVLTAGLHALVRSIQPLWAANTRQKPSRLRAGA